MKKKRTIIILIIGMIFGLVISGLGTYAATTYAISSNKVSYTDNSSLGVDNVQAAIDDTYTKTTTIQSQIDEINNNLELETIELATGITLYKIGNQITITSTNYTYASSSLTSVIPESYRPSSIARGWLVFYSTDYGPLYGYAQVTTDGTISMYYNSSSTSYPNKAFGNNGWAGTANFQILYYLG